MQTATIHQSSEWAFRQSRVRIPVTWYEGDRLTTTLYYLLALPLFGLFWVQYRLSPPLVWSVIGMTIYGVGWIVDSITTWQCFRLIPAYEARGITYPLKERSLFLGEETSLKKQLINFGSLYSIVLFLVSWIAPAVGVAGGLAHMGAAISNRRKWRRLKTQLKLFDQNQSRGDQSMRYGPETH